MLQERRCNESRLQRRQARVTRLVSRSSLALPLAALLLVVGSAGVARADTLDEAEVISLVKAQGVSVTVARRGAALVEAQAVGVAASPNPSLSYSREQLPAGGAAEGESEDVLLLTVPLDLSTRRSTQKHLAQANTAGAHAGAARAQSAAVVQALSILYELAALERRATIEARMVERLVEAARVVSRRREEGNVSGYDQARIELEAQLATSALATTNARRSALSVELALHLGVDERTHFVGSLALDSPPASPVALRPSLKLSEASLAHAAEASEGSSRTWIPTVAVSAGARRAVAEEARYGYVAGVSFALPFFSRGQGLAAQAVARRDHAQAVYSGAQRSAEIARVVAERLLQAAQQELQRFGTATSERALRLEKAAEAGYREGQRSIVDLLDARRVGKDVEMRLVELALSAKQAELALRAAQGQFE